MYTYRIEQAIKAASILHKDQVRKGTVPMPYISHLIAVALIVMDYIDDEDIVIAALLHDTLEDTDYTTDELREDFGGSVRDMVEGVSEPQNDTQHSYSWREQKRAYAKQLSDAPAGSLFVSAADKIHNMRSIVEEYYDDHERFIKDFGGSLDERIEMYQDIADVLNDRLDSDIIKEFNNVFTEYKTFIDNVKDTAETI
jgi:(p)ppGpp synthase/HD superfamily hydrolase